MNDDQSAQPLSDLVSTVKLGSQNTTTAITKLNAAIGAQTITAAINSLNTTLTALLTPFRILS